MGLSIFSHFADLIFLIIFIVIFIAFLMEFKITSKQSWLMLLAFTALGGYLGLQTWRRKKLLEKIEAREKELKRLEKEYKALREQNKITEEAYQNALKQLERAKLDASLSIMKADRELQERAAAIEREYQNIGVDESIRKIKEALREGK